MSDGSPLIDRITAELLRLEVPRRRAEAIARRFGSGDEDLAAVAEAWLQRNQWLPFPEIEGHSPLSLSARFEEPVEIMSLVADLRDAPQATLERLEMSDDIWTELPEDLQVDEHLLDLMSGKAEPKRAVFPDFQTDRRVHESDLPRQRQLNRLFYGDNLEILRSGAIPPASVDLIYLDPPFNSNRIYNVLFGKAGAEAQVQAFDDTWKWSAETDQSYDALTQGVLEPHVAAALEAMRGLLRESNLMSYLVHMTPRLVELHKALKITGSMYVHCDPTASHYLKVMLDAVFGAPQFRNEIIWRRTGAHTPKTSFGPIHDVVLFYTKSQTYFFDVIRRPYTRKHVSSRYTQQPDGRWKFTSGGNILTGPGAGGGDSSKPWRGFDPAAKNRHWAIPGFVSAQMPPSFAGLGPLEKLEAAYQAGLIEIIPDRVWPEPVRYLGENDGSPVGDIWCYQPGTEGVLAGTSDCIDQDVAYLGPKAPERLGYPTQKPIGLMERIITASCPPDGVILDPFCGCGTTLDAAINLNRRWIGIDITYLAVDLIRNRLRTTHGSGVDATYELLGVPADLASAHELFKRSPFDFERWAVSLVRGTPNAKQVGDRGSDGIVRFATGGKSRANAVVSVKGGKQLMPTMVRDLEGVVSKTKDAEMGLLITLHRATKGMRDAAATGGGYVDWVGNRYPKIQILSVEELLSGRRPVMPPVIAPYTDARKRIIVADQLTFGIDEVDDLPGDESSPDLGDDAE